MKLIEHEFKEKLIKKDKEIKTLKDKNEEKTNILQQLERQVQSMKEDMQQRDMDHEQEIDKLVKDNE